MADPSSNRVVKIVFRVLIWTVPVLGAVAFLLMILSPRFNSRTDEWTTQVQTVPAHIQHCDLVRNGDAREDEVRCTYAYSFQGMQYIATSAAWSSDSPLTTSASLGRTLEVQSRVGERLARVHRYAPDHAYLIDDRWIVAPPLWLVLGLLFVACMATCIALIPSVHHRAEMVYQREGGSGASAREVLVEAPGRWTRTRRLTQGLALGCATLLCLYGLSNRPGNRVSTALMTGLQPVSANLSACTYRWVGTTKGNDQIRCGFQYVFDGKSYTGRAESTDFRLFPTNARMDAQVHKVMQSPVRVAYVDPRQPTYARAYIDDDWIVPYTWGIFEAIVAGILLVLLPLFWKETLFPKG